MAMGKRRRRPKQTSTWVATQDLPRSAAHPSYARLNQILDEADLDGYVEGLCQRRTVWPPATASLLCRVLQIWPEIINRGVLAPPTVRIPLPLSDRLVVTRLRPLRRPSDR